MDCEKLIKYRKAQNLTQEKMAKRLGIAHSGYVRLENGYREPSLSVLKRMSEITGYSVEALIYRDEYAEEPMPFEELEAYKAISFSLIKTLCVAPEAKRLGRNEGDINFITLKKLDRMLKSLSQKTKRDYHDAVMAEKKRSGHNARI